MSDSVSCNVQFGHVQTLDYVILTDQHQNMNMHRYRSAYTLISFQYAADYEIAVLFVGTAPEYLDLAGVTIFNGYLTGIRQTGSVGSAPSANDQKTEQENQSYVYRSHFGFSRADSFLLIQR